MGRLLAAGLVAVGVAGASAGVMAQDAELLTCRGQAGSQGPDVEFNFQIDFRRSEVIYLDADGRPMWAAPAEITPGRIRWAAIDFKQFPPNPTVLPSTKQLRVLGQWPYGPPGWTIILDGNISRTTGRIEGNQSGQWSVPRFTGDSFRWVNLEPGTCRIATRKF